MNNILIRNLSHDATEQDIRSLFATHGTIERFKILTDSKTGRPKAFVEMTNDAEAEKPLRHQWHEVRGSAANVKRRPAAPIAAPVDIIGGSLRRQHAQFGKISNAKS